MAVNSFARTIVVIFNCFLIFCGLGCIAVGIWMEVDKYVISYFIVMQRSVTDQALEAAPALLIATGFIIILVAIMGFYGLSKNSVRLLGLFASLLLLVMILELVVGFMVVVFKDDIHKTVKAGMRRQLQEDYSWDNKIGKAWNFIQVRHKCCGADGSWDYESGNWWYSQNQGFEDGLSDATYWVPKSCCVLDFNQDRDPSQVDPQDPRPKDEQRCQEDAEGKKDGSEYLHGDGCFLMALRKISTELDVLIGIGLALGFIQLVGFICSCIVMRAVDDEEEEKY